MTRRFLSRFFRDDAAAAAAEMALVLPMLFALMFTTFEGGHYLWTEHKVVKGVRDGARYAARLPFAYYNCANPNGLDPSAPNAAARETEIRNLTRTGLLSGGNSKVLNWADTDITITVACNTNAALGFSNQGIYSNITGGAPHVVVSTVVTYPSILGQLGFNTASAVVRAEANAAVMGI